MQKKPFRILISILTFFLGISVAGGWLYYQESQTVRIELPNDRWEPIFFTLINRTGELSGLTDLRETKLNRDNIEVRIWRGFGVDDLEGVILKRHNHQWRAFHIKADDYFHPQQVEAKELSDPRSGWDLFWNNVTHLGLLTLRDPSETNCEDSGLDGTNYVVEINQNKIYRTYRMREGGKCTGVEQMEAIDDIIGEEFDSEREECKTNEWFACAKLRKSYRKSAN